MNPDPFFNEVIKPALIFLALFGLLCFSFGVCFHRDIQRWNQEQARRKKSSLGAVILNSLRP